MPLRLFLADDNRYFLGAARDLLEREGLEVVGEASTGAETLRLVGQLRPDVVLVDIDLGDECGFDLASRLAARSDARIVLISTYSEAEVADLVAASPAVGYVPKAELSAQAVSNLLGDWREGGFGRAI